MKLQFEGSAGFTLNPKITLVSTRGSICWVEGDRL